MAEPKSDEASICTKADCKIIRMNQQKKKKKKKTKGKKKEKTVQGPRFEDASLYIR